MTRVNRLFRSKFIPYKRKINKWGQLPACKELVNKWIKIGWLNENIMFIEILPEQSRFDKYK